MEQPHTQPDPAQQNMFWKCVDCGRLLSKEEWYVVKKHAPGCGWASMIPITGRSGD